MSLLSGWDSVQPSLGLIHSLVTPGGLPALRHLSSPLSLHSCHFTRTPDLSSAHAGDPKLSIQCIFSSLAEIVFSLRLQKKFLAPSSSRPDVGKF